MVGQYHNIKHFTYANNEAPLISLLIFERRGDTTYLNTKSVFVGSLNCLLVKAKQIPKL